MMNNDKRQSGLTLVELVIAVVIVAVSVPVLLAAFAVALRGVGVEAESVRIAHIGQQYLEILVAAKRDDQIDLEGNCEGDGEAALAAFDTQPPGGYDYTFECVVPDNQGDPYEFRIEVSGPRTERSLFRARVYDLNN